MAPWMLYGAYGYTGRLWGCPGLVALPRFAWIMPPSERVVAAGRSWRDRSFAASAT